MRPHDIIEYAQTVVGFPVSVGQLVLIEAECCGRDQNGMAQHNGLGAKAEIKSIRMRNHPHQLTIDVDIFVAGTRSKFQQTFSENDPDPQFPFVRIKTAEELTAEAKAAEEKAKAEADKKLEEDKKAKEVPVTAEENRHRGNPRAAAGSTEEDYHHMMYGQHYH